MFHVITPDPSKPFTIGRKESCDLRFGDLFVSREHAVIEKRASGWFLKSLTQNSVTKVNDADVTETALKDGDIIVIGVRMLRAALNGNEFSLLILDQKEDVNSISLSDGRMVGQAKIIVQTPAKHFFAVENHTGTQFTLQARKCKVTIGTLTVLSNRTTGVFCYSFKNIHLF